jgi:hypothetical protein
MSVELQDLIIPLAAPGMKTYADVFSGNMVSLEDSFIFFIPFTLLSDILLMCYFCCFVLVRKKR